MTSDTGVGCRYDGVTLGFAGRIRESIPKALGVAIEESSHLPVGEERSRFSDEVDGLARSGYRDPALTERRSADR